MASSIEMDQIRKIWPRLYVIWGAILGSVFILLIGALYMEYEIYIPMDEKLVEKLRYAFYAMTVITLIGTKYTRQLILSGKWPTSNSKGSRRPRTYLGNPAITRYAKAMMVSLAMHESIAFYGVILFFIGKEQVDLCLLIMVSATSILYCRPDKEQVLEMMNEFNKSEKSG